MHIKEYLEREGVSMSSFIQRISISRAQIYRIIEKKATVSPALAVKIEEATGGKVTRRDLRSDWWDIWPELRVENNREIIGSQAAIEDGQTATKEEKPTETPQTAPAKSRKTGDEDFDLFWAAYPRKEGKGDALRAWSKVTNKKAALWQCLQALSWQKSSEQWTKDRGSYIPHPSTYINQQRWLDEPRQRPAVIDWGTIDDL